MFLKVKLLHICKLVPTIYILINISQSPILIYSISPRPATFLIDQSFRFCIIYIAYVKFRKNWSALTINYSADPKIQQYKAGLVLWYNKTAGFRRKPYIPSVRHGHTADDQNFLEFFRLTELEQHHWQFWNVCKFFKVFEPVHMLRLYVISNQRP